jgi:limonene-1,2-epoxide hydrolase
MSEDAVLEAHVPSQRSVGKDAVRKELRIQNTAATDLSGEIRNVVAAGNVVVVERVDIFTMAGKKLRLNITGVFEFNQERQITAWRDYWDLNDLAQQLGIDVTAIRG